MNNRQTISRNIRFDVEHLDFNVIVKNINSRSNCFWFKAINISRSGIAIKYTERGHFPFLLNNTLTLTIDINRSIFERPINLNAIIKKTDQKEARGANIELLLGMEILTIDKRQSEVWFNGINKLGNPLLTESITPPKEIILLR